MRRTLVCYFALLVLMAPVAVPAATREVIDREVQQALVDFRAYAPAAIELMDRAAGVLVIPKMTRAGFGIGGQYGEGALQVNGATQAYYSAAGASIGLQVGVEVRSHVLLFMTEASLRQFQRSDGWEVGIDGSVALATLGAGGSIDTQTAQEPVIGFIFSNTGLMFNLSLGGVKISPIER